MLLDQKRPPLIYSTVAQPLSPPRTMNFALKAIAPALLLAACAATETEQPAAPAATPEPSPAVETDLLQRAQAALESGDFAAARALTTTLLLESHLAEAVEALAAEDWPAAWPPIAAALALAPRNQRARELRQDLARAVVPTKLAEARKALYADDPRAAMLPLDDAVRLLPKSELVQVLRGECALRMGVEDGNPLMFADARTAFLAAARTNKADAAWLGAARAGWLSYYATNDARELSEALAHAETGMQRLGNDSPFAVHQSFDPERTHAEVSFTAYSAAKTGVLPGDRAAALFEKTRGALEGIVGRDPTDPWAWSQLANLFQWEERLDEARDTLVRGLAIAPESSQLHDGLVRVASQLGGWTAVRESYEAFHSSHAELAIGLWHLARATYEEALEKMLAQANDQGAGFSLAESRFRAARLMETSYTDACLGYEIICRNGLGWSHYHAGQLDDAALAFFSMEELMDGGLRWEVKDQLWSGLDSLSFLVRMHNEAWLKPGPNHGERFPELVRAAEISDALFAYDATNSGYANNAGFFNRDLGTDLEQQGVELLLTEDSDPSQAEALFKRAVEHMERSFAAYQVAAQLAPQDARLVNDCGLVLAYYLQRNPDLAESYFQDAIAVGLPQLEAGIEDEEARTMTREAVGDAYQNLGVLELTLRGNATKAAAWFEKSLGYERYPRGAVTQFFQPLCARIAAGSVAVEQAITAHYWADLEPETVLKRLEALGQLRGALQQ